MSPQTNASKYARSSVPTTARAPHRSPFPHRTSHKQARRITMRVHTGRRLPTPQMISHKLLTALALLAQHGTALDGVSGRPRVASMTCARRRLHRQRRAAHSVHLRPHAGPPPLRRPRRDRGADGRADRAGWCVRRRNSTIPSKTRSGANWSRRRCASAALRPTSGPDNATALAVGPATRGLPGCPGGGHHMAAHEQQS